MSSRAGCIGLAGAVSPLPILRVLTHAGGRRLGPVGRGIEISSLGCGVYPTKRKNQKRTGMGWVMASVLATAALSVSGASVDRGSFASDASDVRVLTTPRTSATNDGPVGGGSSSPTADRAFTTYARTPLSQPLPPITSDLLVTTEQAIALEAFSPEQRELFACIARAESGFDSTASIIDVDGLPREGAWHVGETWWGDVPSDLRGQAVQVARIAGEVGVRPFTTARGCGA